MKKSSEILLFAGLVAAAFLATSLQAADAAAAPGFRARRAFLRQAVVERLGLTADQQAAIRAESTQLRSELAALRADSSLSVEERRTRAAAIVRAHRTQVRAVLTPEQAAKVQQFRQDHPGRGRHHAPAAGATQS